MGRKTFTLKGEAAGEYIRAQSGRLPTNEDEMAARIAAVISVYAKTDDLATIKVLIKHIAREGLESTSKICTAKREGAQGG